MAKAAEATNEEVNEVAEGAMEAEPQVIDSKYRMIILAAQRSKQIQRGARPRVEMDAQRHKPTRVAIEEVLQGKITFTTIEKEQ